MATITDNLNSILEDKAKDQLRKDIDEFLSELCTHPLFYALGQIIVNNRKPDGSVQTLREFIWMGHRSPAGESIYASNVDRYIRDVSHSFMQDVIAYNNWKESNEGTQDDQ